MLRIDVARIVEDVQKFSEYFIFSHAMFHNTILEYFHSNNRSSLYTKLLKFPQIKIQRIQIGRTCRPSNGSSSTNPSIDVIIIQELSSSAAEMCWSSIVHKPHLIAYL